MPISQEEFDLFENYVSEPTQQTELECGNYLHYAAAALLPTTPVSTDTVREDRNFFGSSDFIVTAKIRDGLNHVHNYAYVWEIKAPQCFLFERDDNKNRYRPTKDLVKAENQLIHYAYLAQQDDTFRQRFNIMDRRKIMLGGIVIGRSQDRFAKGVSSPADLLNAKTSFSIREAYFYIPNGIRVFTWDTILAFCKP